MNENDMLNKADKYTVAMGNELIRKLCLPLSMQSLKVLCYCISQIKPDDTPDTWYTISISSLARCCGLNITSSGTYYKRLKQCLHALAVRSWDSLPGDNSNEYLISWLGDAKAEIEPATVTFRFNPFLHPYLFDLIHTGNYTQYRLYRILCLQNKYSILLYLLLRTFVYDDKLETGKTQSIRLDASYLTSYFGFSEWRYFKRDVIDKAITELNNKSDEFRIDYNCERERFNNAVDKVVFTITPVSRDQAEKAMTEIMKKLNINANDRTL